MPPVRTPDGRYLVVEGKLGPRLWRASNPGLSEDRRQQLVDALMDAQRAVGNAGEDTTALVRARSAVDEAKRALGERGPVWWDDGSPDLNRRLIRNTLYRDWWASRG